jgi:hypothetical protein
MMHFGRVKPPHSLVVILSPAKDLLVWWKELGR